MSTRDEAMEWAVRYFGDPDEKPEDYAEFADALIAKGWRKMPREADIYSALVIARIRWQNTVTTEPELAWLTSAILALMDGGQ